MTEQGLRAIEETERLRLALEQTADALASADLDALLRSDADLALALERVTPPRTLPAEDRAALRAEVEGVQRALARCRRLGGVLLDVVRTTLEAQGRTGGYGRHAGGRMPPGRLNATG
jgi:hypothetical protein